jgi:hypothetical protein
LSGSLRLQFAFAFSGHLWNIALDDLHGWLVAEVRDATTRRVRFAAIDRQQNRLLWKDFTPDPSWWWGIAGLNRGVLLLHQYVGSQRPEIKGVMAVEVSTGQVLWQHTDWAFQRTDGPTLTLHRTGADQLPVYQMIDLLSGQVTAVSSIPPDQQMPPPEPDVQYPRHYSEESPYFQPIARFLGQQLDVKPLKAFDYAEFQGLIVVSYYICEAHSPLSNRILVLDKQARILLHESVATQLSGVGMDPFLISKGSLIFVREKKELLSYALC